jgi:hypothetical protein
VKRLIRPSWWSGIVRTGARWVHERPFLVAVVVLLIVVIPGMIRLEMIANDAQEAAENTRQVAVRNAVVVTCLTEWVAEETDVLTARDGVSDDLRDAQRRMWVQVREYLTANPPDPTVSPLVAAIEEYLVVLERLDNTATFNPYPDIAPCLAEPEERR